VVVLMMMMMMMMDETVADSFLVVYDFLLTVFLLSIAPQSNDHYAITNINYFLYMKIFRISAIKNDYFVVLRQLELLLPVLV